MKSFTEILEMLIELLLSRWPIFVSLLVGLIVVAFTGFFAGNFESFIGSIRYIIVIPIIAVLVITLFSGIASWFDLLSERQPSKIDNIKKRLTSAFSDALESSSLNPKKQKGN